MRTLFKGGTVVSGQGTRPADVLVEGETISAVGMDLSADGAQIVDCAGKLLFPGFIDAHTHFDLAVAGTVTADDFATGSRAALRGGTTTVIDYAAPDKGETLACGLAKWREKAADRCACDYGFHMAVTEWNEATRAELADMEREGVTSFKAYMAYENLRLNDKELLELFKATADIGVVGVHCELGDEVNSRVARLLAEGKTGPEWHPRSRPNEVESLAVRRCLALAREAGGNAWVVHLSTREGLAEIEAARGTGQRVLVETCPQYLTLTDEVYEKPDFEGAKFVCSPPIRSEADKAALWGGIKAGEVDIISTDHCSFNFKRQKELGRGNFSKIPNGLPGIEHRPMLLWTEGVNTGKLSAEEFCRLLSTEPAKAFGMYPRKGELKPGADADIVVWDPEATMRLTATDMNMLADYSPWEGAQLRGLPKAVFLHGELAAEKGRVKKPCGGRYVRREKSLGF